MLKDFNEKVFGKLKGARMMTMNLVHAVEEEKKGRRFTAAGVSRGGVVGVARRRSGSKRAARMPLAEGMAESDPFAMDQSLETAQRARVRVEQDLGQRRDLGLKEA